MIETYHRTSESKRLKKAKDEIVSLKKVSSKVSKEVRKFWLKIDRIISFKQKMESDEVRQKVS
jgi:hypothetical protein